MDRELAVHVAGFHCLALDILEQEKLLHSLRAGGSPPLSRQGTDFNFDEALRAIKVSWLFSVVKQHHHPPEKRPRARYARNLLHGNTVEIPRPYAHGVVAGVTHGPVVW